MMDADDQFCYLKPKPTKSLDIDYTEVNYQMLNASDPQNVSMSFTVNMDFLSRLTTVSPHVQDKRRFPLNTDNGAQFVKRLGEILVVGDFSDHLVQVAQEVRPDFFITE